MKIVIVAHILDEEGYKEPSIDGSPIEVRDELAIEYLNKSWAVPYKETVVERAVTAKPERAVAVEQKAPGEGPKVQK